jgi:hypothetical protein
VLCQTIFRFSLKTRVWSGRLLEIKKVPIKNVSVKSVLAGEAKTFRTFSRVYCLFRSEWLSANIKLTLYKKMIRSVMTYACPTWEFAADTHLLKLQCVQNKVLCITGKFPMCTLVHKLHISFQVLCIYDYITKLCRQQAKVVQNHENANVHDIRKGEARYRTFKRLKLGYGQANDCSSD